MKIDLIHPNSVVKTDYYLREPPIGLITLYSSLNDDIKKGTRILDGEIMSFDDIISSILERKPHIVGISCNSYNYENCVKIAGVAKSIGSIVVLGGIHISIMQHKILKKMLNKERNYDFLISNSGAEAFSSLVSIIDQNSSFNEIPNLSYIEKNKIVINRKKLYGESDSFTSIMDYSCINFKEYNKHLKKLGILKNVKNVGTIFTQLGCSQNGKNKCVFCSISQIHSIRSYKLLEQDILSLVEDQKIDHFRIMDADFIADLNHLRNVSDIFNKIKLSSKKEISCFCYLRVDEIDSERLNLLKKMNVIGVFLGFESGSNKILKTIHKNITKEQSILASKLLNDFGIEIICGSFVLGCEGEDEHSLLESLDFIRELKSIGNITSIVVTPLIPFPGTIAYRKLLNRIKRSNIDHYLNIENNDIFNIDELVLLWNQNYCNVSLKRIFESINDMNNIIPESIIFYKKDF